MANDDAMAMQQDYDISRSAGLCNLHTEIVYRIILLLHTWNQRSWRCKLQLGDDSGQLGRPVATKYGSATCKLQLMTIV